tara:strand:+ start:211 stop:594 length:384 start_codon:yes stop_codon:yes gene_type:complete
MAHFALLENNIVTSVAAVDNSVLLDTDGNEQESLGVTFLQNLLGSDTSWKQTSYNNNFRKNFAGIGYSYDSSKDAFIAPQPYSSWILNETTCRWDPPVPYPTDTDNFYEWDEATTSWITIDINGGAP